MGMVPIVGGGCPGRQLHLREGREKEEKPLRIRKQPRSRRNTRRLSVPETKGRGNFKKNEHYDNVKCFRKMRQIRAENKEVNTQFNGRTCMKCETMCNTIVTPIAKGIRGGCE